MEITEVRIKLVAAKNDKLRAFCSITIDNAFVIRDLKIIEGAKGPFVAMPSRKVMERCRGCSEKNHHRANFCNECGTRLSPARNARPLGEGAKLHADIAHPINSTCRETLQRRVLDSYAEEVEQSGRPDYSPQESDEFEDGLQREPAGAPGQRSERAPSPERRRFTPVEAAADLGDLGRAGPPRPRRESESRVESEPRREEGGVAERRGSTPSEVSGRGALPPRAPRPQPPYPRPPHDGQDVEPEDNFGAGLLS